MKTNTRCRICRSDRLSLFLDLGLHPIPNAYLRAEMLDTPEPRYPLRAFFCHDCNLAQLIEVISPEVLYRDYVYFSAGMPTASKHWSDYALDVSRFFRTANDLVVEIGSNDGVLLEALRDTRPEVRILGVDPARNIAAAANARGIPTLPEFFNEALAKTVAGEHGLARVVLANNVVAHIDDHHDLLGGITALLAGDGVFIFEAPYLLDMFERLAFDSVYHEHLSYLAIRPIMRLLDAHGMEIFDVKTFPVQGVSIRVYSAKKGARPVSPAVQQFIGQEVKAGLDRLEFYKALATAIERRRSEMVALLLDLKRQGKRIAAYGAPARGNTLLNYFGIGRDTLDYATEELPSKVGLYTPGTHLPIVHVEWARANPPDYYFLLAWNYLDKVLEKEHAFRKRGGKFILPIGEERVV